MAKKKLKTPQKKQSFGNNPFSDLKGFSTSDQKKNVQKLPPQDARPKDEADSSFTEQMAMLGVERLKEPAGDRPDGPMEKTVRREAVASEESEFLLAMKELQVDFKDSFPEEADPLATAEAGRMKQVRRGRLVPEASLDLHGCKADEVAEKIRFFLQDVSHHGFRAVLLITGRGLHSADGRPVLRNEAERFLASEGGKWLTEWGRAPKSYGGEGALILFVRKSN